MSSAPASPTDRSTPARRVFLIGGWRRWLMPLIFGGFALLGVLLLFIDDDPATRSGGAVLLVMMLPFLAFGEWVIRLTRLTLSADGVELRQLGYRLQTSWRNIEGFYGKGLHQGFVLTEPLTGKGADKLAFASGFTFNGAPMYDDVQSQLLVQRRFIPIEAFAWHLDRGLRERVIAFAPHLAGPMTPGHDSGSIDVAAIEQAARRPARSGPRTVLLVVLVSSVVIATLWLVIAAPPWAGPLMNALLGICLALFSVTSAVSVVNAWRSKRWGWVALFTAQTAVLALLALTALGTLAGS